MTTRGRGRGNSKTRSGRLNQPTDPEDNDPSTLTWSRKCAPRDTSAQGSVDYPLTAEGGLNKFHPSYKHARNKEGIDNIKIKNEKMNNFNQKSANQILNFEIDTHKTILMAIADSDDNSFVKMIMKILEKGITSTGETITNKVIEVLLQRRDRYDGLQVGNTLQTITNDFFNENSEFPLLKYGNGENDKERGDVNEAIEMVSFHKHHEILDEFLKYIMTKLSGDKENFVHNKAFEKKIDDLGFQNIREVFNI